MCRLQVKLKNRQNAQKRLYKIIVEKNVPNTCNSILCCKDKKEAINNISNKV